jgi:hypothetical protein
VKVIPFPQRRRPPELERLPELLAGRLQTWSELLRVGAGTGAVLAEMRSFLEYARSGFQIPGDAG